MFDFRRTHNCGSLTKKEENSLITLSGWVNKRRDLGKIIFIDLRDKYGITQLVIDNSKINQNLLKKAEKIRLEYVISIKGKVKLRDEKLINKNLSTGEIEIDVEDFEILSESKTPPFSIFDDKSEVNEELRLKYRYLDIRKGKVINNLAIRHKTTFEIRKFLDENGFLEIETPILSKTTPEGARDYLVPSRIFQGNFYALPQSPQLYKQLLMISSIDKYFQIAKCFRDEDLRADRQPEFTQVDMEMSFKTKEDIFELLENLMKRIFKKVLNKEIETPFLKMPYEECIEKYGTDRPDLRFKMEFINLKQNFEDSACDFLKSEKVIKGFVIENKANEFSRKETDKLKHLANDLGLKKLVFMKMEKGTLTSSINKFLSDDILKEIIQKTKMKDGDMLLIGAGEKSAVNQTLDHLRRHIAKSKKMIDKNQFSFLWVVDFPMFSHDEKEDKIKSEHHPFTSPKFEDIDLLEKDPLKVKALAYDLVLNGYEIAGGSQRIHSSDMQEKVFNILGLTKEDIEIKFGFFIEALKYGTPPHLGIAIGLDRLIMILSYTDNIKDVIAFPKTQKASDLMNQSPSKADEEQLKELNLSVNYEEIFWK